MIKNKEFVHLHVHSEYSLLDGLGKIKQMLLHTKKLNMNAIAITDHGALYGAIEFYKKATEMDIKPIIGIETYLTDKKIDGVKEKTRSNNFHLLLLAKNEQGYKNLLKLSTFAHLKGYYYKPRIDHATLAKYSKGLICTSACAQGEVARSILEGNLNKTKKIVEKYLNIFGDDYYLEIQRHLYDKFAKNTENDEIKSMLLQMSKEETIINENVIKLSRQMGIPLVATNDCHYIKTTDASAQDALLCIATGKQVKDIKRMRFIDNPSFYIKSPDEMIDLFSDVPEAIENTIKISDKCNLKITTLGKWFFPKYSEQKPSEINKLLKDLVYQNLPSRVGEVTSEVKKRLEYELNIIISKGYSSYFLIVMDMVAWANEKKIITNTRGSVAGSLVSYVLGITNVNPLIYYLPFERFLNPFRPSPPDIDFDVSDDRREEVISYISEKYGKDKVAQICTFGRMLSRASVRDVARVLGYPYATGDRVSKLIPPPKQGFPITIPKALEEVSELKNLYDNDPDAKKILDLAMQMEGNARHISVHAAGIVISPTSLTDFTPLQLEPSGDKVITQYEFHTCEDVGLIKFDILGIRNLSILGAAIKLVEIYENSRINLSNIPLDDKKTFVMLGRGDTMGTFQLSSPGMTKYLKDLKPTRIEDLMAMVALYRPGPIAVIPDYIRRKKNPKLIKYPDVRMRKFLEASYGLLVYQDDLLFCAIELAGYTWEEADKFRKAVGKKIPEEMLAQKEKFVKGIISNGQTQDFAEYLWRLFEPFQAYGFNKAHAASYGMVAYQTAYMKANYPVEFMTALLTAESSDKEKISLAINECRRMKIKVMPPDINESEKGFKIVKDNDSLHNKAIRFGLGAIKNVGEAAIKAIIVSRKSAQFKSYYDFLNRIDLRKVNKKVIESLIKVGALSAFGNRSALLKNYEEYKKKIGKNKLPNNQENLFSNDDIIKSSATDDNSYLKDIEEFKEDEMQLLERELLGFSLSSKPIDEIIGELSKEITNKIGELHEEIHTDDVSLAGVIRGLRIIVTKRSGQEMAFVKIEDETGSIDLVVFPKLFSETRDLWLEGKPILVTGKIDIRDDKVNFLVESAIKDISLNKIGDVYIKIPDKTTPEQLKLLRNFLYKNLGQNKAILVFDKTSEEITLPVKIIWNETIAKSISNILNTSLS